MHQQGNPAKCMWSVINTMLYTYKQMWILNVGMFIIDEQHTLDCHESSVHGYQHLVCLLCLQLGRMVLFIYFAFFILCKEINNNNLYKQNGRKTDCVANAHFLLLSNIDGWNVFPPWLNWHVFKRAPQSAGLKISFAAFKPTLWKNLTANQTHLSNTALCSFVNISLRQNIKNESKQQALSSKWHCVCIEF